MTVSATSATSARARRVRIPRTGQGDPLARAGGLVAAPPDGQDEPRVDRILLDLRAQASDRDIDQPGIAEVVVAPNAVEQLVAREDLARALRELDEEVELGP